MPSLRVQDRSRGRNHSHRNYLILKLVRFLADENIPKNVASWLAQQGHEVIKAQDAGLTGAADSVVANWAIDNGRMILTLDEDFVGLCRRLEAPLGVILIKTHPSTPEKVK